MTTNQHNILFLLLFFGCIYLILTLNPPSRNFIPIIWGFLGFVLYWFLFFNTWLGLSRKLIDEHRSELKDLNISYHDNSFKKTVDMFALFQKRKKIEDLSADLKISFSYYQTYFRLAIIGFIVTAILGVYVVFINGLLLVD
ncbi:hypothetical protein [Salibacter halophilus]|uniref:Uncharacterized protein n=1 Tax=Salibacter halophilus TaxID=1803916 RepID=A0A6N6M7E7_9FLAO|nr:hypothetical protein [Salibacter halophilus]KAB1065990.1 hypothetical protein F3059_00520 [Salibacter halophilus]